MTHVIAGTDEATQVVMILFNGENAGPVVEADEERGILLRLATDEEVERLVTKPGLVWPNDRPILIQEHGEVRIVWFEWADL